MKRFCYRSSLSSLINRRNQQGVDLPVTRAQTRLILATEKRPTILITQPGMVWPILQNVTSIRP